MLIKFETDNYKSFRDGFCFDLEASPLTELKNSLLIGGFNKDIINKLLDYKKDGKYESSKFEK